MVFPLAIIGIALCVLAGVAGATKAPAGVTFCAGACGFSAILLALRFAALAGASQ